MKILTLGLFLIAAGCATPSTPGPGAEICLQGDCMRVPNTTVEHLMDWCEQELTPAETQALDSWSKNRMLYYVEPGETE